MLPKNNISNTPKKYEGFKNTIIPYDKSQERKARNSFRRDYEYLFQVPDLRLVFNEDGDGYGLGDNTKSLERIPDANAITEENIFNKLILEEVFKKLTPRQRDIIELKSDGYSYKEIAEELGIKEQTARVAVMRIRKKMSTFKPKT